MGGKGRWRGRWGGDEIQQTTNSTHSRTILKTEVSLPTAMRIHQLVWTSQGEKLRLSDKLSIFMQEKPFPKR